MDGEVVILTNYKFHFIREHDNLVQDPGNNKSIYLLDIRMEKICWLILGVHLGPQGHDGGQMFPLVTNNHHVGDDLLHLSLGK